MLENIERHLEMGKPVREATLDAMKEITGPIIAITLVLSSVLLPSAFLGGITGPFFKQFALTISVSMLISAINAMTMTPARAAWIFGSRRRSGGREGMTPHLSKEALPWWFFGLLGVWRPGGCCTAPEPVVGPAGGRRGHHGGGEAAPGGLLRACSLGGVPRLLRPGAVAGGALGRLVIRPVNWLLGTFFRGFNWLFDRATQVYGKTVGWCLRPARIVLLLYAGLIGLTGFGFTRIPVGFIPMQDKGYLVTNIQLPDSASLERTLEVTDAVEKIAHETPGVAHTLCLPGMSYVLNAISSNYGNVFIILKPFHERRDSELERGGHRGPDPCAACAQEIPEARVLRLRGPAVAASATPPASS